MSRLVLIIAIAAIFLFAAGIVVADRVETDTRTVDAEGAEVIDLECDFAVGSIYIQSADIDNAAEIEITYSPRYVDYDIGYRRRGRTGVLTLESDFLRRNIRDDFENEWQVELSTEYEFDIDMEIGACEVEIDLGGLAVRSLDLELGASSGLIDFSKPTKTRVEEISISVGASSMEIANLGNASFDRLTFEGGAASCDLDFRGGFSGEGEVELEVGLGSCDIIVPRDLAIRVETDDDAWFSSVDFHGLRLDEVDDGIYETEDFDDADDRIIFVVEVGMGSVDFRGK
ncbi:MAG: hypothetical protein JSU65_13635 [Candidatus Zixiibacteriota bacterium]|nr:MAG: hypothetical protein JSU65_13635 [candidate division Zixibacteria bacterium]